jgi:fatty acid-binding protein DegV
LKLTTYSGDTQKMTKEELIKALNQLASNWRAQQGLGHQYSEGLRYNDLTEALKNRFNISLQIKEINGFIGVVSFN